MIFQDPMSSLNPVMTIGAQIREVLEVHTDLRGAAARRRAVELLEEVGIPDSARRADHYPHQFSGGMRQRAMIAIAIACTPRLLIADEPTTALDVTVQAQILALLRRLIADHDMAMLLITHDLGVVAETCGTTNVMYGGRVVETAPTREIFRHPSHPYTVGAAAQHPQARRRPQDRAWRRSTDSPRCCGRLRSAARSSPDATARSTGAAPRPRRSRPTPRDTPPPAGTRSWAPDR